MNCCRHTTKPAVAQCQACGNGVCEVCAEASASLRENFGTLCVECYSEKLREIGSYYAVKWETAKRSLFMSRLLYIIGAIAMVLGIILAVVGTAVSKSMEVGFYGVLIAIIGFVLMGVFPGLKAWREEEEAQIRHEQRYGAKYVITESGNVKKETDIWSKVFGVAFALLFGPISSLLMWSGFKQIQRECEEIMTSLKAELDTLEQI